MRNGARGAQACSSSFDAPAERIGTFLASVVRIAIAIACLDACSGGSSGCSGSKGCSGCGGRDDRDEREDRRRSRALSEDGTSTPATRAVAEAITSPSGAAATAATAAMPPPASGLALEIYPPAPVGHLSRAFRVRVGGKPAYVERYGDASYVRFAFEGNIDVDIDVDAPIATHRVIPGDAVSASAHEGRTLRLSLPEPATLVVEVNSLERLFLIADPIEAAPVAGTDGVASVAAFGASASAPGIASAAIQSAIDAASAKSEGGTVLFPPGRYVAGALRVKSNVTLYFAAGALLEGSTDPGDYPNDPGRVESGSDTLLLVDQASNVRIRGRGTIDGHASLVRQQHEAIPIVLLVRESQDVTIEDVMLRDSAASSVHLAASSGALLRNVKVLRDRGPLDIDGIEGAGADHALDGRVLLQDLGRTSSRKD